MLHLLGGVLEVRASFPGQGSLQSHQFLFLISNMETYQQLSAGTRNKVYFKIISNYC